MSLLAGPCPEDALRKALWLHRAIPNEGWVAATSRALLGKPPGTLTHLRKSQEGQLWDSQAIPQALPAPSHALLRRAEVPAGTRWPLTRGALWHRRLRPIREHPGWASLLSVSGKAVKQVLLKVLSSLVNDERVPG